jgi:hypothetical protein
MNSKTKKITPNLDLKNMNATFIILLLFNFILTIVPPIIGLLWFNNLKKTKCQCSNIKWYNDYIIFYFIFIISYATVSLLYLIIFRNIIRLSYVSILLMIYNIISYGIIVFYINQLNKKHDCNCANSIKKDFLYIWYFIKLIFSAILIMSFIVGLLIAFMNIKK